MDKECEMDKESVRSKRTGLILLLAVLAVLVVARNEIMLQADACALTSAPSPNAEDIFDVVVNERSEGVILRRLWDSGKLLQRRAVVDYLQLRSNNDPEVLKRNQWLVAAGMNDLDLGLRETLISCLYGNKNPGWIRAVRSQLRCDDSYVQTCAIDRLRVGRVTNVIHEIGALLEGQELDVRLRAAVTLRSFTGVDHGVAVRMGTRYVGMPEHEVTERLASAEESLGRVVRWWATNKSAWPVLEPIENAVLRAPRPMPVFEFERANAEKFKTSEVDDRPLMLVFFVSYCPSCQATLPHVARLNGRIKERVKVVGVSLDAVPDEHNHFLEIHDLEEPHAHGDGHDHHHDHGPEQRRQMIDLSAKIIRDMRLGFDVVFDTTGVATLALNGGEVPVIAHLGEQGALIRRYSGLRTHSAMERMLRADFPAAFSNGTGE